MNFHEKRKEEDAAERQKIIFDQQRRKVLTERQDHLLTALADLIRPERSPTGELEGLIQEVIEAVIDVKLLDR